MTAKDDGGGERDILRLFFLLLNTEYRNNNMVR